MERLSKYCNPQAKAGQLYSFPATPGKQCLRPKVSLGGLRDRTVEYTTWVLGITVFAQSFHYNREFRGQSCSAVLIFRNPWKAMSAPKSVSRGVAGSYCWVYYIGIKRIQYLRNLSIATENFEAKAGQLHSFPATPGKQCLLPKVSVGGLRDRTVEYTTWVLGNTVFAQSFPLQQKIWGQGWSAALISRNPRKAMFAPKSVSRGVAGSYCWVDYMGKGNYSICSIFPLQQRFSKPQLFGNTNFPYFPVSAILKANVAFRKLRTPTDIVWMLLYTLSHTLPLWKSNNAVNSRWEPNRMEPNESMNRSRHEPQRNRTGTNRFAVHKVIFEPMRIECEPREPCFKDLKDLNELKIKIKDLNI